MRFISQLHPIVFRNLRQRLDAATRMTRYSAVYASKLSHLSDLASSAAIPRDAVVRVHTAQPNFVPARNNSAAVSFLA
jgi:hypothetical protein